MKPQDPVLANIAEAAKRVMNKETEVQPSDKDFVDLHSIDKEKRRGSTPLTEKDIEEANEFTKAAAKAAVAGDDDFEFDGKKFPSEMDVDVAKKILGESTDLDESSKNQLLVKDLEKLIKNPDPSRVKEYGGTKYVDMLKSKLAKLQTESIEEAIKWWTVTITKKTGKLLKGQTVDVKASNPAQAIKKGLKQMKADPMTVPSDSVDVVLGESIEEAFIDVDHADPRTPEAVQLLRKYKIKGKVLTMKGPGGMPLVRLTGKKKDLEAILKDPDGWQDNGFLAGFIEESADLEEAFIDVDTADPRSREFEKLLRKYKIKGKVLTMKGPGGGMPLVRLTGKKKDLEGILKDPKGWEDDGFLAGFIEESADVEMTIEESESQVDEELTPYIFGDGEASVDEAVNSLDRKKAARNGANFKWEDINKALMSVGMSPPNILKVSSALRGKEQ